MKERTRFVHDHWVEAAVEEERKKHLLARTWTAAISFSVGFLVSNHTWWAWIISVVSYIIFYFLWRLLLTKKFANHLKKIYKEVFATG